MSFQHMQSVLTQKGDTIRQSKIIDGQRLMKHQFDKDPSYKSWFYFWQFGVEPEDFQNIPIKTFKEKYSAAQGRTIEFNALIDESIQIGDVLVDTKTNEYWVCTESYDRDEILNAGKLTLCNYWMRWQDKETKQVFDYPVFDINSTQYNSGESGDKTITLGSSQHLVTVTADENTITLDHDVRMFWDRNIKNPTVFKVTQNDTTAMFYDKGICKITITEDQYNPDSDSIENWLCDYKEVPPKSDTNITIIYSGNPTIRVGGTKTLRVETDSQVDWSVEGDLGITLTPNNNSVTVRCPNDYSLVDRSFVVKATVDGAVGSLELTITGGV